jgi:hypothetical protein
MPVYVWHCATCKADLEIFRPVAQYRLAPKHAHPVTRVITAAHVNADIKPYVAVAGDMAGKEISSRRAHREFLKRNRFVEVGNEPIRAIKNDTRPKKGEVAAELKHVIQPYLR